MIPNGVSDHHAWRSFSITLDITFWQVVYTGIASNADAATPCLKLKKDSSEKTTCCIYVDKPIAAADAVDFAWEECKGTLTHSLQYNRRRRSVEQIITHMEEYSNILSPAQVKLYGPSLTCG